MASSWGLWRLSASAFRLMICLRGLLGVLQGTTGQSYCQTSADWFDMAMIAFHATHVCVHSGSGILAETARFRHVMVPVRQGWQRCWLWV